LTRRLLFSYLGLAVLILLILEVPLATLAQRFERQLATSQIEKEADGLVALISDDVASGRQTQLTSVISSYKSRTGGEVTVILPGGAVLASASDDEDSDAREWHGVIARALAGQTNSIYTSDEGKPYGVAGEPVYDDGRLVAALVLGSPTVLTQHRIHEIWLALGAFAIGAIVVAGGAGIVLARSLSLPLGRLEATVARFGSGELSTRAGESHGPPEIRSLAARFNQMAGQLDELVDAQKRFVADASHQLRSPLTALRLRLENLEATADASSQDSIAAVGQEVQRLSRIVDGLLTLSRSGGEAPATVDVDVRTVIEQRCDAWSALAAEKGVTVEASDSGRPVVQRRLHPGDLDQIIDNLLANAVEVSPDRSRIEVALAAGANGSAEVHVIDHGPGLADDERKRAFDRFWQGAHRSGHSGLGLAIVRQLAGRNGLDVELRAADPHGVDAVVVLPARGGH
jgi:signal transduction histidine kinase